MDEDERLAADLAKQAGDLLLELRSELGFADPARLRAAGDSRAQTLLGAGLAATRPSDAVLSEEAADSAARLSADRVWIIDPLDGTREYGEAGRTDWAVHVALWERTRGLAVGAVALPALGVVLCSGNAPALPTFGGQDHGPRVVVSRTRPVAEAGRVIEAIGGVAVEMGSAGAKVAAVVRGEAEVYVHSGGQHQWDSAAPVAVARAAGLHTSRIDGSPLVYNGADTRIPDLVVCLPELANAVLAAIAGT